MSQLSTSVPLRGTWGENASLAPYVSWRAGGRAKRTYAPADLEDLVALMRNLPQEEPLLMVGLGSNLLIRDGGFNGTVILLHGNVRELRNDGPWVYAEAGAASPKVAHFAVDHELTGAEFLAGIPGTIGGALAMNAGCYGGETWNIVEQVVTLDRRGRMHLRAPKDYDIGYRHVALRKAKEEIFLAAWFKLEPGDKNASKLQIKEWQERRLQTQPLQFPNAGSVFRNPPNDYAARLIEEVGLKGHKIGGAQVSDKHANFIINYENTATAADIENLIRYVQHMVEQQRGIKLIPEVKIVGDKLVD